MAVSSSNAEKKKKKKLLTFHPWNAEADVGGKAQRDTARVAHTAKPGTPVATFNRGFASAWRGGAETQKCDLNTAVSTPTRKPSRTTSVLPSALLSNCPRCHFFHCLLFYPLRYFSFEHRVSRRALDEGLERKATFKNPNLLQHHYFHQLRK